MVGGLQGKGREREISMLAGQKKKEAASQPEPFIIHPSFLD